MAKHKFNPLDAKDIAELMETQRALVDILPAIDATERCGVDCTKFRADQAAALNQITAILTEFAPKSAMGIQ